MFTCRFQTTLQWEWKSWWPAMNEVTGTAFWRLGWEWRCPISNMEGSVKLCSCQRWHWRPIPGRHTLKHPVFLDDHFHSVLMTKITGPWRRGRSSGLLYQLCLSYAPPALALDTNQHHVFCKKKSMKALIPSNSSHKLQAGVCRECAVLVFWRRLWRDRASVLGNGRHKTVGFPISHTGP